MSTLRRRDKFAHFFAVVAVVGVLLSPMYFTSRGFGRDWPNHLWLLWVQGDHIARGDGPRLFLDTTLFGSFFPFYTFYGGTLYALGGALSVVLGDRPDLAFLAMWTMTFGMAYGGLLWLSMLAGLTRWRAHAAPLLLVTAAYYLTNAYARGVWAEATATSALIVVLAAGVHLLRARSLHALPIAAFLLGVVVFSGSHNITLVWGTVVVASLILVSAVALPHHGLEIGARRLVVVVGLGLLGVAVNAWFLLPNLSYAGRTQSKSSGLLQDLSGLFTGPGNLLDPLRHTPEGSTTPDLFVQLPTFAMVWIVVVGALALRDPVSVAWRRFIVGTAIVAVALLVLLTTYWPWHTVVPRILTYVQFSFRLESYILLCFALLLIALLVWLPSAAPSTRRVSHVALAAVLAFNAGLAVWQVWHTPSFLKDRNDVFVSVTELPTTWYDSGSFRDGSQRIDVDASDTPQVVVPPDSGARDRTVVVPAPAGVRDVTTNLATGPYLLKVDGAQPIGRTASGWLVLRRPSDEVSATTMRLTLATADSPAVVLGRWATRAALAGVAIVLGVALVFSRRRHARHRHRWGG